MYKIAYPRIVISFSHFRLYFIAGFVGDIARSVTIRKESKIVVLTTKIRNLVGIASNLS